MFYVIFMSSGECRLKQQWETTWQLFSSVQSLSRVWLLATSWTAARQDSLSITNSWSSLRLSSIELVWPQSRTLMTPCASEDMEQQDSLLVRVQSGTATLEDRFIVSCKIKHAFTIPPQNHTLWNFPKGAENLCLHKILHTDVYWPFIHHCQKLGFTKMSFSRWMDKQSVVHSDNGVFFSSKKKWIPKPWKKKEHGRTLNACY